MNLAFPIPFTKMSGTGNDFILIDHRQPRLAPEQMPAFARQICERRFSVGADGLILIEEDDSAHFRWQFFNGDGSAAEMCGNGARCAARFAHALGIAPARMRFATGAGIIEAEVAGQQVRLRMTPPTEIALDSELELADGRATVHALNTGVPHAVLFVDTIEAAPVLERGRLIRFHQRFAPAGTNVNFVQRLDNGELLARTYERGVEGETMACGTGAVACAIVAGLLGLGTPPLTVRTAGNERLTIHYRLDPDQPDQVEEVFLEGPARFIYHGELHQEAVRPR